MPSKRVSLISCLIGSYRVRGKNIRKNRDLEEKWASYSACGVRGYAPRNWSGGEGGIINLGEKRSDHLLGERITSFSLVKNR